MTRSRATNTSALASIKSAGIPCFRVSVPDICALPDTSRHHPPPVEVVLVVVGAAVLVVVVVLLVVVLVVVVVVVQ